MVCAQIWGLFAGFACARTGLWGLFTREIECGPHAREAAPVLFQYPPVAPPAWLLLVGSRKKLAYSYSFSKCEYEYALAVLNNSSTVVLPCTVGTSYICWLIPGPAVHRKCVVTAAGCVIVRNFDFTVSLPKCLGSFALVGVVHFSSSVAVSDNAETLSAGENIVRTYLLKEQTYVRT